MRAHRRNSDPDQHALFTTETRDGVVVLTLCDRVADLLGMNPTAINQLWRFFAEQARTPSAAIVIHASPSVLGPESIDHLLYSHGVHPDGQIAPLRLFNSHDFLREMNAIRRFIEVVTKTEMFVVVTLSGSIVLPLFGPIMACDARVASTDFTLVNRILDYCFTPLGGLPWFLTQLIGRTQAKNLLRHMSSIDADNALQLGLVDEIAPQDRLVDAAVAIAQELAGHPYGNRVAIKQTSVISGESLNAYLIREEALFRKSIAKFEVCHAYTRNRPQNG